MTSMAPLAPGHIRTTITYLEMTARPARAHVPPPLERAALMRAEACTVSFYRYLYNTVGEPWLWELRRRMDDDSLREIIQDARVEIYVCHVAGVPAGYVEIDRRQPGVADIAYFGLIPDFIGRRLGHWLLDWAIEAGWTGGDTGRMTVNTCTFDHPKALLMYQRAGFVPVRQLVRDLADPRLTGVLPRHAAPHVPLGRE
ncbi:MAG: hypothetical protein RLY86_3134 [Pseudomonadota bacterium]